MWRKNTADPYGVAELKRIIPEILWTRTYMKAFVRKYHMAFSSPSAGDSPMPLVKVCLDSPLAFFSKTEGPERDPTWLHSLPTEALRLFMKHALDLAQGFYQPEIKGALSGSGADKFSLDQFHKGARVSQRFATNFHVALDSVVGPSQAVSADASAGEGDLADSQKSEAAVVETQEPQAEKRKLDSKADELASFRQACEQHCARELEGDCFLFKRNNSPYLSQIPPPPRNNGTMRT